MLMELYRKPVKTFKSLNYEIIARNVYILEIGVFIKNLANKIKKKYAILISITVFN